MKYLFHGNLKAYLCKEYTEALQPAEILFYKSPDKPDDMVSEAVSASPKSTLKVLNEEDIKSKNGTLIGRAKTDADGNFKFELDDRKDPYRGGPVQVDAILSEISGKKRAKESGNVHFSITTLQPAWREAENHLFFHWEYIIPSRFWCYIRSLFDAWVIIGRVVSCTDKKTPIAGADVTVFDADWLTDDQLGTDTTDSNGWFRINYTSIDFKQTFLSPVVNVETNAGGILPLPPYNSGPDVYFKITKGAVTLLEEQKSDGQVPGRANIGNCFCVSICVDTEIEEGGDEPMVAAWIGIGDDFLIPDGTSLNDFDADGYGKAQKYAFYGALRMTGQAPRKINGHPVEYRFRISTATAPNGTPPLPESNFTQTVGVDAGLLAISRLGSMIRFSPSLKVVNIYSNGADFDSDGWLDVNKSIERTFINDPSLNPGELSIPGVWQWIDADTLVSINSAALTGEPDVPPASVDPGDPVPLANRIGIEKMAIRFEIREVIDKTANNFNYLPGSGHTLNALVINNNPTFLEFAIKEQGGGNLCGELSGIVNLEYTLHHPHLMSANINVRSNDGAINKNLTDGFIPLLNNTSPSNNHQNNNALPLNVPGEFKKCTYIVQFSVVRRLTNGDGYDDGISPFTTFYHLGV